MSRLRRLGHTQGCELVISGAFLVTIFIAVIICLIVIIKESKLRSGAQTEGNIDLVTSVSALAQDLGR